MFSSSIKTPFGTTMMRLKVPAGITAILFAFAWGLPAQATVFTPNIDVTSAELKAKCTRSGGTWERKKGGVTRCTVKNGDTLTIVECENGRCDGYILDKSDVSDRRKKISGEIKAPRHVSTVPQLSSSKTPRPTAGIVGMNGVIAPLGIIAPSN